MIAGRGQGDLATKVKAAAQRFDHVDAEIGFVSSERMAELFATSTAVVLPYTRLGSQSGLIADAYVHRLPLIVTDVGAIGPTVGADGTGIVLPANDPHALADALTSVAADTDAVARWRDAIERIGPRHDHAVVGADLRKVFGVAMDKAAAA